MKMAIVAVVALTLGTVFGLMLGGLLGRRSAEDEFLANAAEAERRAREARFERWQGDRPRRRWGVEPQSPRRTH